MRRLTADEGGLAPPFETVDSMFEDAVEAIEKAGGSITLIEKKVLAADEEKRAKTAEKKAKAKKRE